MTPTCPATERGSVKAQRDQQIKFTFKDFFLEGDQTRMYLLICYYLLLLPKCRGEGRGLVIVGVVS